MKNLYKYNTISPRNTKYPYNLTQVQRFVENFIKKAVKNIITVNVKNFTVVRYIYFLKQLKGKQQLITVQNNVIF